MNNKEKLVSITQYSKKLVDAKFINQLLNMEYQSHNIAKSLTNYHSRMNENVYTTLNDISYIKKGTY